MSGAPMAWLVLGIAALVEIVWALSLKWAATQGSWMAAPVPVLISVLDMVLLGWAMRDLPTGTAYAVWTGLGSVGVAIMGVVLFGEKLNPVQIGFIALIVIGVVGTKLFASA